MNLLGPRDDCEVAVIGAGPYGLAAAAHLKAAKIATRVFGDPMATWRKQMPKGMRLSSPWVASHIADPNRRFSLDAFGAAHGIARQEQLPLENFVRYGEWFQRHCVPDLDRRMVVRVEDAGRSFCLSLDDGKTVQARRVVVAMGLTHQQVWPAQFKDLPAAMVSHSCDHASLDGWYGKRVAVVGRGQSACESAALLREAGSEVELICRGDVAWLSQPLADPGPAGMLARLSAMLAAPSAVGPFPLNWLNELPTLAHRMPMVVQDWISRRSLKPAAASWVKPRFAGVRVATGRKIVGVSVRGNEVCIQFDVGLRSYHHVLLATGYGFDLARCGIFGPQLLRRIACAAGAPLLESGFESSVRGLHFIGAGALKSFGPLMRFVAGSDYAARSLTRVISAERSRSERAAATQMGLEANAAENALL